MLVFGKQLPANRTVVIVVLIRAVSMGGSEFMAVRADSATIMMCAAPQHLYFLRYDQCALY